MLLIASLAFSPAASARIGETPEQCDKRYGELVSSSPESRFYKKGVWGVAITFQKGCASTITFNKGSGNLLTPREIGLLLDKNKLGGVWDHQGGEENARYWGNWKESLHATVAMQNDVQILLIMRRQNSMKDEEQLKGF